MRVMVVDDNANLRFILSKILEQSGEIEVVGLASDGHEAVRVAADVSPDVVLMDVAMPLMDGVVACRKIMLAAPDTRVVLLTASSEETATVDALAAGATGYLLKESGMERLLATMRGAAEGEFGLPSGVVRRMIAAMRSTAKIGVSATEAGLSGSEIEILTCFAKGMSYPMIADAVGVESIEVSDAVDRIAGKLKVESMRDLVLWAVRNRLLDDYAVGSED